MRHGTKQKKQILISAIWLCAGYLASHVSVYLFSYLLSPVFIKMLRRINATAQSSLIKSIANIIYAHAADFLICFLFASILSYFTKFTKIRLSFFVFGAIAISMYIRVEGLIYHMGIYSEFPSWAVSSYVHGFISMLVIVPRVSYIGSNLGNYLSNRYNPKTKGARH